MYSEKQCAVCTHFQSCISSLYDLWYNRKYLQELNLVVGPEITIAKRI